MEDDTNIDTNTDVELTQQVLDENGQLADESVVSITTTLTQNFTLGELKSQLTDLDSRLDNLESFYQTQKTFLENERQKINDQINQL